MQLGRSFRTLAVTASVGACSAACSSDGTAPPTTGGAGGEGSGGAQSAGSTAGAGSSSSAGAEAGAGAAGEGQQPGSAPPENVQFSVSSRTFEGSLSVTLDTPVAGSEIRYTTDGSVPGPDSTVYTGTPIDVERTVQLRAQVFDDGVAIGAGSTALYIERTFDA